MNDWLEIRFAVDVSSQLIFSPYVIFVYGVNMVAKYLAFYRELAETAQCKHIQ